jgi:hypothetical protein
VIIGITGQTVTNSGQRGSAGAGKDTVCSILTERHDFQSIALADPLKRICKEVFDFSDEQLWGPSQEREKGDMRYVVMHMRDRYAGRFMSHGGNELRHMEYSHSALTPRTTLQSLGTWGRECFEDIWVDYAMRMAKKIADGHVVYDHMLGARYHAEVEGVMETKKNVCISDVRYRNEVEGIRKRGGLVWRVVRPVEKLFTSNAHQSEIDLNSMGDHEFDAIIYNDLSIEALYEQVYQQLLKIQARSGRQKLAAMAEILQEPPTTEQRNKIIHKLVEEAPVKQSTVMRLGDEPLK